MKFIILICLTTFFQFCFSQQINFVDSVSRAKADIVLSHFDSLQTPKLIYSIDDKYFYLIIKDTPVYKEYYITTDSIGNINEIYFVKKNVKGRKQRKQEKQYQNLLLEADPFNLSTYHTNYVTAISQGTTIDTFGRLSYFVLKDVDGKRYGEFHLFLPVYPLPIHSSLWTYLIRRISDKYPN
jgi:hypothetical protein